MGEEDESTYEGELEIQDYETKTITKWKTTD